MYPHPPIARFLQECVTSIIRLHYTTVRGAGQGKVIQIGRGRIARPAASPAYFPARLIQWIIKADRGMQHGQ